MKIRTLITVLFLIALCKNAISQKDVSIKVLVPFAGVITERGISYSQSVGEPIVETLETSSYVLTQGFQQPSFKIVNKPKPDGTGVLVYPNPVTDFVTIEMYGERAKTIRIDIINITGRTVYSETKIFDAGFWYIDRHNVEDLLRGLYLIRVSANDGMLDRVFKIEKL
jgi:hypothetical protein